MDSKFEDYKSAYDSMLSRKAHIVEGNEEPSDSVKRRIMTSLNIDANQYAMFKKAMTKLLSSTDEAATWTSFQELSKEGKMMVITVAKRLFEGNVDIMLLKQALKQM